MPQESDSGLTSPEARIIQAGMVGLAKEQERQGETLKDIGRALEVLAKIEQAHSHVVDQLRSGSIRMTDHEDRIRKMEQQIPPLLELRRWVVTGILAGLSMMGVALMKLVIVDPARSAQPPQVIYMSPPAPVVQVSPPPAHK